MGDTIETMLATNTDDHHEIRAAAKEAMFEDKLNMAQFARAAGINETTFSAFMSGKYAGDNEKYAQIVKTTLKSRAEKLAQATALPTKLGFVNTPSAEAFMSLLRQAQFMPDMVTLVGAPGVGKTSAVREYQRKHRNVFLVTASPLRGNASALLDSICDEIGLRNVLPQRRPKEIAKHLRGRQGLIVIDEAQNATLVALDQIRALHDDPEVQVGIALVGHFDIKTRMMGGGPNGQHAQLDSRFGAHMTRRKPQPGDIAALLAANNITDEEQIALLRTIAGRPGALRSMDRTLRMARMLAQGDAASAISAKHIIMARDRLSNQGEQ